MIADEVVLRLRADTAAHIAGVNRAQQNFDRRVGQMERRASTFQRSLGGFFAIGSVALAAREIADYADTWTQVGRALESTESIFKVRLRSASDLADMARETRSDLLSLTKLYTRTAASTRDLGLAEKDVATVTATVAKALKLGSASATEQASTMLQLSQAFAKGKLDGDEFRTVMENATVVQAALSKHLGVSRGEIIKMAADGKLKVQDLVAALLNIAPEVDRAFGSTTATISEAFTNVGTAVTELVGTFSEVTGSGDAVVDTLDAITDAIAALVAYREELALFGKTWRAIVLMSNPGTAIAGAIEMGNAVQSYIDPTSGGMSSRNFNRRAGDLGIGGDNSMATLRQRLADLNKPASSGIGDGDDKAQKKVEKSLAQVRQRIDLLKLERTTLGQSTYEITRRKVALELEQQALEAGVEITPKLRLEMQLLAMQTANHVAALEMEEVALRRVEDAAQASFDAVKQGFADVLLDAKSFEDALGGILRRFAEIALDNVFTSIFAPAAGGMAGGPLGGIFGFLGSLFTGGRAGGGNIASGKFAVVGEEGPELAKGPMTVYPNAQSKSMAAGGTSVVVNQSNDFRGVGAAEIARLRAELQRSKAETVAAATAAVAQQVARSPGYLAGRR